MRFEDVLDVITYEAQKNGWSDGEKGIMMAATAGGVIDLILAYLGREVHFKGKEIILIEKGAEND
jgi:hypothetical protein